MIDLHANEREEVLGAFERVVTYLSEERDTKECLALACLDRGALQEAMQADREAIRSSLLLTYLKAFLQLKYAQTQTLH